MKEFLVLMLKAILPIALDGLTKFINTTVAKAENKFNTAKSGATKKAYVLKQVDQYIDINPEVKKDLGKNIAGKVEDLIESAVKKL